MWWLPWSDNVSPPVLLTGNVIIVHWPVYGLSAWCCRHFFLAGASSVPVPCRPWPAVAVCFFIRAGSPISIYIFCGLRFAACLSASLTQVSAGWACVSASHLEMQCMPIFFLGPGAWVMKAWSALCGCVVMLATLPGPGARVT